MSQFRGKAFERYADLRPGRHAPSSPSELLAGVEPVFRKFFVPVLPSRKDARVLDLGCGYGEFLYFLQREDYDRAAGVDLDPKQVEVARNLGVKNLRCGDGRAMLMGSPGEFDFVSAIDVLEHFPKDEAVDLLSLVYAALRPGGRFLCQVPNAAAFYLPLIHMDFTHETFFTAPSLKQVLEMAGFVNVRVAGMGPVGHGVKSGLRVVLWKAIEGCLRFIQVVEAGPGNGLRHIFTATIFAVAEKT